MRMQARKEEAETTFLLFGYVDSNDSHAYKISFPSGESYECTFKTAFEDSNDGDDIDGAIGMDDPRYLEFETLVFDITNTIHSGPHEYDSALCIDYRTFPLTVEDLTAGVQVYPPNRKITQPVSITKASRKHAVKLKTSAAAGTRRVAATG